MCCYVGVPTMVKQAVLQRMLIPAVLITLTAGIQINKYTVVPHYRHSGFGIVPLWKEQKIIKFDTDLHQNLGSISKLFQKQNNKLIAAGIIT